MMAIDDAGARYPQQFRLVCSAGEPLNPEAIRWFREQYGVTVLDYYGLTESYPLVRQLPLHGGARRLDGQADAGLGGRRSSTRTSSRSPQGERGEICLRARSNPQYPLGYWRNPEAPRRPSAASGSTPRTPPRRTRTATTGTRAAPTT